MKKILVIFGGKSNEHDVSISSTKSISKNIDKNLFKVDYIYIDKKGIWKKVKDPNNLNNYKKVKNYNIITKYDKIFPLIHGEFGEDGKIQGLFEIYNVNYVGSNTKTSAIAMDKVITKELVEQLGIPVVDYLYINKNNYDIEKLKKQITKKIKYPCFIKPANAGSSFGAQKVENPKLLEEKLNETFKYDNKVLVEKLLDKREIEVAILGNENRIISEPWEIIIFKNLYDYETKYNDINTKIQLANLTKKEKETIKKYAITIYEKLECKDLARIDFFIENETNKIYFNEINTMPGFTKLSMYPFLIEQKNITYKELITKLMED